MQKGRPSILSNPLNENQGFGARGGPGDRQNRAQNRLRNLMHFSCMFHLKRSPKWTQNCSRIESKTLKKTLLFLIAKIIENIPPNGPKMGAKRAPGETQKQSHAGPGRSGAPFGPPLATLGYSRAARGTKISKKYNKNIKKASESDRKINKKASKQAHEPTNQQTS